MLSGSLSTEARPILSFRSLVFDCGDDEDNLAAARNEVQKVKKSLSEWVLNPNLREQVDTSSPTYEEKVAVGSL
jgi:hypothetical protein